MSPYYADDWLTIYQGDCREVLPELAADSVDCVVTSPPYWGLRDYGTATWVGGDPNCVHWFGRFQRGGLSAKQASNQGSAGDEATSPCPGCGAVRQDAQLGLEPTPEQYVANLVAVFREVRRVLKPSGTCWLNLGDSYASSTGLKTNGPQQSRNGPQGVVGPRDKHPSASRGNLSAFKDFSGLKPKDLVGIPWRVAFALQADGWYLRSDIIWAKPNPMPESVTDRPTKAHEYLFLLTKSARYFFDADAVREASSLSTTPRPETSRNGEGTKRAVLQDTATTTLGYNRPELGRNLRSVWTIATRPYAGSHFAVFPPELPERCIKAGSSERGVCPECGAPWERVLSVLRGERDDSTRSPEKAAARRGMAAVPEKGWESERTTTGWQPTCRHDTLEPQPAVVLDMFAGSGTVGLVANRLNRKAVLIDLNPEYLRQQMARNAQTPMGLGA